MQYRTEGMYKVKAYQNNQATLRNVNPSDISIQFGYKIEVFAQGLDSPISILFDKEGAMFIAESGYTTGNPRVLRMSNGGFEVVADNFRVPLTGINFLNGDIYVSHRGFISKINSNGTKQNVLSGLPSNGDHYNSRVVFGPDNKMYFGQGTITNSGVVGIDNTWIYLDPLLCDYPGNYIMLSGQNFETYNPLTENSQNEKVNTGAFSPFGVSNLPYEVRKGIVKASGSIQRANLDGTELELFAWGFRNPVYMKFDENNRLFTANNGYEDRGSRPILNAYDEFFLVSPGEWHGWPDYSGGEPVTLPKFQPHTIAKTEFLLAQHPNIPLKPFATFPMNSIIMGFDFNYNKEFGPYGDVYIAEFGSRENRRIGDTLSYIGRGQRVSKIDMHTGEVSTFAINKSGLPASMTLEGGFERPADVVFGPDGAMYVLDLGWNIRNNPSLFVPKTGVVWKITKI